MRYGFQEQGQGLLRAALWVAHMWRILMRMIAGAVLLHFVLFVVSQVTLLLALLLPWNILASLTTDRLPWRVAWLFDGYGPATAVPILMALVVGCFVAHLLAEAGNARLVRQASRWIVDRHDKTGLSDALRGQAAPFLGRLLRLFSVCGWLLLAAIIMALLYPALFAALLVYIVVGALVILTLRPGKRWGTAISADLRGKAWWGVGFIWLVGCVIYHAWHGALPHFWALFPSLLLGRQILVFLTAVQTNVTFLLGRAERVEALFLPDAPLAPPQRQSDGFAGLAQRDRRAAWLPGLLAAYGAGDFEVREQATRWETNGRVLCLLVDAPGSQQDRALLIRVFHKNIRELGRHERNILVHAGRHWPVPEFLGESELREGHLALVFEWAKGQDWLTRQEINRQVQLEVRKSLLACEVPAELVDRYKRGNIQLGQHLARIDWVLLRQMALTPELAATCDRLRGNWSALLRWLDQQPFQVLLDKLVWRLMARGKDGAFVVSNWANWRLEPLGIDWPLGWTKQELEQMLAQAALSRPALLSVAADDVCLVARLEELRKLNADGNYTAVFGVLGALETQLTHCVNTPESGQLQVRESDFFAIQKMDIA
jgi:hypothetical protein